MTASDPGVVRSTRVVAVFMGLVAGALLVLAVGLAAVPVRVPPVGDSSGYRCSPIVDAFAGAPMGVDCAQHITGRLAEATIVGGVGGVLGLVALVVALAAGADGTQIDA